MSPQPVWRRVHLDPVMQPRSVRVQPILERTPAPPWVCDLPFPEPVDTWPGSLLAWRWLDPEAHIWTGLVRYRREGLLYEHWLSGDLLDVGPDTAEPRRDAGGSGVGVDTRT